MLGGFAFALRDWDRLALREFHALFEPGNMFFCLRLDTEAHSASVVVSQKPKVRYKQVGAKSQFCRSREVFRLLPSRLWWVVI